MAKAPKPPKLTLECVNCGKPTNPPAYPSRPVRRFCSSRCGLDWSRRDKKNRRPSFESRVEHFWAGVDIRGSHECWPWKRGCNRDGYGDFSFTSSRAGRECWKAHRFAHYIVTHGELPEVVMHTCDNPPCCNPAHLRGGTNAENQRDAVAKGRHQSQRQRFNHPVAKLTLLEARAIYYGGLLGCSTKDLATSYDVSMGTVQAIRAGRRWQKALAMHG